MALVRVYCGLASAPPAATRSSTSAWLTAAVVDDAGRLIDVCDISDDPVGYAELGALLAERSGGSAGIAVATDSADHQVTLLLAAAGRTLALAEEDALDDYAERFGDDESLDEVQAPPSERRAIGLARALQAGALAASTQGAPRELMALKPILAAHATLATGRQGTAIALREVLRELYPAALRAYPDPAEPVPLAILDAIPEPGMLTGPSTRAREEAAASALADAGVADLETVTAAITSLRIAISETPRRVGIGASLSAAVAETIRQAVAAVRACDSGITALVTLLAEKATPVAAPGTRTTSRPMPTAASQLRSLRDQPAGAATRAGRAPSPGPLPSPAPPSSPAPMPSPAQEPVAPAAAGPSYTYPSAPAAHRSPESPTPRQMPPAAARSMDERRLAGSVQVPPHDERRLTGSAQVPPHDERRLTGSAQVPPHDERRLVGSAPVPTPDLPRRADRYLDERRLTGPAQLPVHEQPRLSPEIPAPGSRGDWPLNGNAGGSDQALSAEPLAPANGRVTPPWQADDLPAEPPTLRLVEQDRLPRRAAERDPLRDPVPPPDTYASAPPLRLVDPEPIGTTALDAPITPDPDDDDSDLLIFAQTRSAWFTGHADHGDDTPNWSNPADVGWQAAERASSPVFGDETEAGLPRRVPAANLVPGSPLPPAQRPLRIVRDPAAMAQHTTGYFRGSRRGEEVRGFALGGRPGREAASGWDFSRDGDGYDGEGNPDLGYEYRSAARH